MRDPRLRGLLVAAAALTLLASCSNASSTGASPSTAPTTQAPAQLTTMTPGFITVGSCLDYAPFETVKGKEPTGFDVELTEAIAAKLGYDKAHVSWVKANFNTIFTAVAQGNFDVVAAAVTSTGKTGADRAQVVSFSDYYYNSRQSLAVNPVNSPDITSPDQLGSGDSVGVQKGTTGFHWAVDNLQSKGVEVRSYTSATDAFRDLSAGNLTGIINDESSSYAIAATMTDVKVVAAIETNEKYSFAFAPTNAALVTAWNDGLAAVISDGEYAVIFEKYFPGTPPPDEYSSAAG